MLPINYLKGKRGTLRVKRQRACLLLPRRFDGCSIYVQEHIGESRETAFDWRNDAFDVRWPLAARFVFPGFVNLAKIFVQLYRHVFDFALKQVCSYLGNALPFQIMMDGPYLLRISVGRMGSPRPPIHQLRDVQSAQTVSLIVQIRRYKGIVREQLPRYARRNVPSFFSSYSRSSSADLRATGHSRLLLRDYCADLLASSVLGVVEVQRI